MRNGLKGTEKNMNRPKMIGKKGTSTKVVFFPFSLYCFPANNNHLMPSTYGV